MLGAQRLIQVGSSLSADGVQPELRFPLYHSPLVKVGSSAVATRAYSPTRDIPEGFRAWPKTLSDFAFGKTRLAATWGRCSCLAEDYPFWPDRIQHSLCRVLQEGAGPRQRLAIVPGHPLRWRLLQFLGVPLQLVQIVERVGAV